MSFLINCNREKLKDKLKRAVVDAKVEEPINLYSKMNKMARNLVLAYNEEIITIMKPTHTHVLSNDSNILLAIH